MANTFKLKTKSSVSNSALEDIYTAPASALSTVLIGCLLSNKSSTSMTADVKIATNSTSGEDADDVYLVKEVVVPPGISLEIIEGKVVIGPSDKIKVLSSVGSALDVTLSIMEIT
jgi:hypothetical protein